MASFHDITVGQQIEFSRVLSSAGFTKQDVERIIRNPSLAKVLHGALLSVTTPEPDNEYKPGKDGARRYLEVLAGRPDPKPASPPQ